MDYFFYGAFGFVVLVSLYRWIFETEKCVENLRKSGEFYGKVGTVLLRAYLRGR
jgi:hypothetical protein